MFIFMTLQNYVFSYLFCLRSRLSLVEDSGNNNNKIWNLNLSKVKVPPQVPVALVSYCCVRDHHKFSNLKQHPFINSQFCKSRWAQPGSLLRVEFKVQLTGLWTGGFWEELSSMVIQSWAKFSSLRLQVWGSLLAVGAVTPPGHSLILLPGFLYLQSPQWHLASFLCF